ncbi:MAG TPA: ABC transporter permease, partial [Solirubrobacterales bacterium]|nr:ABC transporter permease [Solirubrobacterales bacterium]
TRAVRVVWRRELLRFTRDRLRMVTSLMQPILFLFILGTGLSGLLPSGGQIDFRTFMFPGVIAMTVLFTALFSAISVVWDREFGFLREMLVAPVRRGAIVVGKCAGGATVATFQGALILALAGLVHVPYSPVLLLTLLGEIALTAFALTAVGMMLASRMTQIQSFQAVMQFVVLPMFFLSGAVFPAAGLPGWLSVMTRLDPLTYAVDPMRRAVFAHVSTPAGVRHTLNPGVTWGAWRVPTGLELAIVAAVGLVALGLAIWQFNRAE